MCHVAPGPRECWESCFRTGSWLITSSLSAGLDTLWIVLYAGLTLMALLSVLLYLEECVYFFQKLPYPKKTAIIWVNGAAPVSSSSSSSSSQLELHRPNPYLPFPPPGHRNHVLPGYVDPQGHHVHGPDL